MKILQNNLSKTVGFFHRFQSLTSKKKKKKMGQPIFEIFEM